MAQNAVATVAKKPKKEKRSQFSGMSKALVRRETISAYLFLLPSLIFFIGFVVIPMIMCVVFSFQEMGLDSSATKFVGFANYTKMAQDPIFWKGFLNTVIIVVVAVPAVTAFSLWVSSAIYQMKAVTRSFFRCVFYLPVVTGTVAVTVVWKWMFNPYNGLLNQIFGTTGYDWLGNSATAIWCIILILFTTSIGQPIVLYVAALGNVDQSLVEAAQVDGATKLQVFWKIKWPQIMPTTLYILVAPGVLEDQVAPDHAHHPVHPGHHHHQLLPVLRADPVVDLRWTQPRHRHHYVLHLPDGVQQPELRLRQRYGRHPGHHHRDLLCHSVQVREDRQRLRG